MNDLSRKKCVPCEAGTPPMPGEKIGFFINQVSRWDVIDEHHLTRKFKFKNFAEALKFVNAIGDVAEEEGHHPDIELGWGKVGVTLFTHKANGLSENDFIMAAKIDEVYNRWD